MFAVVLVALLYVRCGDKATDPANPHPLLGTWRWIGSIGEGISLPTQGHSRLEVYDANNIWRLYLDDTLNFSQPYEITTEKRAGWQEFEEYVVFQSDQIALGIEFIPPDTVKLVEQLWDGWAHTFVKVSQ